MVDKTDRKTGPTPRQAAQRFSVTLVDGKGNTLIVRTERRGRERDDGFKSVVIHVRDDVRKRGMSAYHSAFDEARARVEKLAAQARKAGWTDRRRSRAVPDEFDSLPEAK